MRDTRPGRIVTVWLPETPNFKVGWNESRLYPHAQNDAQGVHDSCEVDLAELLRLFGIAESIFGAANKVTVRVDVAPGRANAVNHGYFQNGGTDITVRPADVRSDSVSLGIGRDIASARCVAELAEVLMSYLGQQRDDPELWNAGGSAGEGLSRVCAAMLHPEGYYRDQLSINTWLLGSLDPNNPLPDRRQRPDYVSATDATDVAAVSFGCAIVVLYYLHDQLGHSWEQIIAAGGHTLTDTFRALGERGEPVPPFQDLLERVFPWRARNQIRVYSDNPFPLRSDRGRFATISLRIERPDRPDHVLDRGKVNVRPFPTCPARLYRFERIRSYPRLTLLASPHGIGVPHYDWRVNGQSVASGGNTFSLTVDGANLIDRPDHPGDPLIEERVGVPVSGYSVNASSYHGLVEGLSFGLDTAPGGHIPLTFDVEIVERYDNQDSNPPARARWSGVATTERVVYEKQFYADRADCQAAFQQRLLKVAKVERIPPYLFDYRPDPPLARVLEAQRLSYANRLAARLAADTPKDAAHVRQAVAEMLGVNPTEFGRN